MLVHYDGVTPGTTCALLTMFTYPSHIVKSQRTEGEPSFIKSEQVMECSETLAFETIEKDKIAGTEERHEVIRDEATWNTFWESNANIDSPVPSVDFQEEMVIVVALGARTTAGYEVNITRIEEQEEMLGVYYDELIPELCGVLTAITYPSQIIKLQTNQKEASFIKNEQIIDCG